MKIYLAGKITHNGWRNSILERINYRGESYSIRPQVEPSNDYVEVLEHNQDKIYFPVIEDAIFGKHDYTGPHFIGDDHGCGHGDNSHGVNASNESFCFEGLNKTRTATLCRKAIKDSDLVFAWIDDPSAYGTIAELGYAHGLNKKIAIAGPEYYPDLWFVYKFCWSGYTADFTCDNPRDALAKYLVSVGGL